MTSKSSSCTYSDLHCSFQNLSLSDNYNNGDTAKKEPLNILFGLPNDLLNFTASFLSLKDFFRLRQVSKYFQQNLSPTQYLVHRPEKLNTIQRMVEGRFTLLREPWKEAFTQGKMKLTEISVNDDTNVLNISLTNFPNIAKINIFGFESCLESHLTPVTPEKLKQIKALELRQPFAIQPISSICIAKIRQCENLKKLHLCKIQLLFKNIIDIGLGLSHLQDLKCDLTFLPLDTSFKTSPFPSLKKFHGTIRCSPTNITTIKKLLPTCENVWLKLLCEENARPSELDDCSKELSSFTRLRNVSIKVYNLKTDPQQNTEAYQSLFQKLPLIISIHSSHLFFLRIFKNVELFPFYSLKRLEIIKDQKETPPFPHGPLIEILKHSVLLEKVSFLGYPEIPTQYLYPIFELKKLKKLAIETIDPDSDFIRKIASSLRHLRSLSLAVSQPLQLSEKEIELITAINLRELFLTNVFLTDERVLQIVNKLRYLEKVICKKTGLTEYGKALFEKLPYIKKISTS